MSGDSQETNVQNVTPPAPDVPVSPSPEVAGQGKEDAPPTINEATQKMADEIKSGRSPYNFRGELEEKKSFMGNFPFTGIVFAFAIIVLSGLSYIGYQQYNHVLGSVERMSGELVSMSEQLRVLRGINDSKGRSVLRAELQQTLVALERVMAVGEPELTLKALGLRGEIVSILSQLKDNRSAEASTAPPEKPAANERATQSANQGSEPENSDLVVEDPVKTLFGVSPDDSGDKD